MLAEYMVNVQPGQVNNQVNINPIELPINHAATNQPNDLDVMFEDLNQFYMEEHCLTEWLVL